MKNILIILIIIYMSALSLSAEIIMGVVPQQSPMKLLKVWNPIVKYLSEETGEKIIFKTEKSIHKFEEVLYSGGYDFAYMNPYHYVVAHKKKGYTAEIRANKDIRGIIVAHPEVNVENLKDTDHRFLFPSPNAFAATLLTKYDLLQIYKISPEKLEKTVYVNSHDSVYKGVARGIGTIGGGIERTFKNLNDENTKRNINIIHRTKAYPSHPFAFNPSMNEVSKQKLINALLKMPQHMLKNLSLNSLKKIDNSEYDTVKELAIKLEIMPE